MIDAQDPSTLVDNSYNNAVQGFEHGTDKIDLSQLGIGSINDLTISKVVLYHNNGVDIIHGVKVYSNSLGLDGELMELIYLDAVDVAQVTASDFIFAPSQGETVTELPVTDPNHPNMTVPNTGLIDPGLIGSNNGVSYTQDGNGVVAVVSEPPIIMEIRSPATWVEAP